MWHYISISVIYIHNPPHIFLFKESADPRALKMGSVLKDPGVFKSFCWCLREWRFVIPGLIVFFFQSPFPLKRCTNPSRSPTWFKRNIEGGAGKFMEIRMTYHQVGVSSCKDVIAPQRPQHGWKNVAFWRCHDLLKKTYCGSNPSWDVGYPFCGWFSRFSCSFPLVWLENRVIFCQTI